MSRLVAWRGMLRLRLAAVGGAVALAVTGVLPGSLGAATAAGMGQPCASNVSTSTIGSTAMWVRYSGVPVVAAKVRPQTVQR